MKPAAHLFSFSIATSAIILGSMWIRWLRERITDRDVLDAFEDQFTEGW
jgi:hypothetical protein